MLILFLVILALVLFILATVGVPSAPRFNLMAGGLASLTLALALLLHLWPVLK